MGKNKRRLEARRKAPAGPPAPSAPPSRLPYPLVFAAAILVIAVFAVFAQTRAFPFINFDDPQYVARNEQVQKGLTPESAAWAFTSMEEANWHPLTWLSHMVDLDHYGRALALQPGSIEARVYFALALWNTGARLRTVGAPAGRGAGPGDGELPRHQGTPDGTASGKSRSAAPEPARAALKPGIRLASDRGSVHFLGRPR